MYGICSLFGERYGYRGRVQMQAVGLCLDNTREPFLQVVENVTGNSRLASATVLQYFDGRLLHGQRRFSR